MTQAHLSNGVTLEYEIHGDVSHPVVFVILGITDNITDWPVGLYAPVVDKGLCVVRFELRDSGLSTKFDDWGKADLGTAKSELDKGSLPEAPYTVHDVALDAKLLLDHLKIDSAWVVGYSYGSMVAQLLTLAAPEKVLGLICLQGSNYNPELSPRTKNVEQAMLAATLEYESTEEKINAMKNLRIATNGSIHALDEQEALDSATTSVSRMYCPAGTARIVLSRFATAAFYQQTSNISCPALILHGDEDPIFPLDHGEDMTNRIPNAHLSVLRGAGHNHPLSLQPAIANQIVEFVREHQS